MVRDGKSWLGMSAGAEQTQGSQQNPERIRLDTNFGKRPAILREGGKSMAATGDQLATYFISYDRIKGKVQS